MSTSVRVPSPTPGTIDKVPRDSQRQKTYNAEYQVYKDTSLERPLGLETLKSIATLIASTPWWHEHRGARPGPRLVPMPASAKKSSCNQQSGVIKIGPTMDTLGTLCHEMAHLVAGPHDAQFRGVHVEMLRLAAADASAERLRQGYLDSSLAVTAYPRAVITQPGGLAAQVLEAPLAVFKHQHARALSKRQEAGEAPRTYWVQIGSGAYAGPSFDLLRVLVVSNRRCSLLSTTDKEGIVVALVGEESDVLNVVHLYEKFDLVARREMLRAKAVGNALMWRRAFLMGFTSILEARAENLGSPFVVSAKDDHPQVGAFKLGMITARRALLAL